MRIRKGEFAKLPNVYSKELNNVISCMLTTNPCKRPSVDEILKMSEITLRNSKVAYSDRKLFKLLGTIRVPSDITNLNSLSERLPKSSY